MARGVGAMLVAVFVVACAGAAPAPTANPPVAERRVEVPVVSGVTTPAELAPPCSDADAGERAFSSDGNTLAVARDTLAVVYETTGFTQRATVDVGLPIRRMRLSPQGDFLLAVAGNGSPAPAKVLLASTRDGKVLLERPHVTAGVEQHEKAVFAPDGSWLALAVPDAPLNEQSDTDVAEHVEIVELPSLTRRASLSLPDAITDLPHPKWRPRRLPRVHTAPPSSASANALMWPTGPTLGLSAGGPVPNDPPEWSLDQLGNEAHAVADLMPDPGSRALMIEWVPGAVSVVDARAGKSLATLPAAPSGGGLGGPSWSPRGRFAVLPRGSRAVTIYDVDQHKGRVFYDPLCAGSTGFASFNHAEDSVVIGGWSFTACVVNPTAASLRTLLPPKPPSHGSFEDEGFIRGGAWRADDRAVVLQELPGHVVLWDVRTKTATPVVLDGRPASDAVTRSKDGSLAFLDELGKPMAELVGSKLSYFPPGDPEGLASGVSPDGERVLMGAAPPLKLFSTRGGAPLVTLKDDHSGSHEFDPSSRFVFTADGALFVWRVKDGALVLQDPKRCASPSAD